MRMCLSIFNNQRSLCAKFRTEKCISSFKQMAYIIFTILCLKVGKLMRIMLLKMTLNFEKILKFPYKLNFASNRWTWKLFLSITDYGDKAVSVYKKFCTLTNDLSVYYSTWNQHRPSLSASPLD